jgi:hypothetical protein
MDSDGQKKATDVSNRTLSGVKKRWFLAIFFSPAWR